MPLNLGHGICRQVKLRELHDEYFSWRQEELSEMTARRRLRVVQGSSNMLLVGESIGPAPACLEDVMTALSIPDVRVPRTIKQGMPVLLLGLSGCACLTKCAVLGDDVSAASDAVLTSLACIMRKNVR